MLCQQTCATMGVCTCGQWEASRQADPVSRLEERLNTIHSKQKPKVVVISTPAQPSHFEKMHQEARG